MKVSIKQSTGRLEYTSFNKTASRSMSCYRCLNEFKFLAYRG